jgi:hypothetical protein
VRSIDVIRKELSVWRPVADAPSLARDSFGKLDPDEVIRLAMRAYTEEVRQELRRKVDGVPVYTSVIAADSEGNPQRLYKQTELFDVSDYRVAIDFYLREAEANRRVAKALAEHCKRRLGVQLMIPGLVA